MHVDGNNHGPYYIIALGNYAGGAPWTYDRKSTENYMEVWDSMRNYSELQVGSKVPGRIHDIRYKLTRFDGDIYGHDTTEPRAEYKQQKL
jgi:hypothetical protein